MNFKARNIAALIILAFIFLAPGIIAVYFYYHSGWLTSNTTNKGEFVQPALLIPALHKKLGDDPKLGMRLILWVPTACNAECFAHLEQLYRVRLALGRRYYNVQAVLLTGASEKSLLGSLSSESLKTLQEQAIHVVSLSQEERQIMLSRAPHPMIYIADSQGYLVLSYPLSAALDDIYRDLKLLLTNSAKGN